ncbi:hypothetical protein RJ55_06174 [Drechmeria coniospora]|nr:hypothetical protein RJ55_06174 [Drechmeria coniospora]
MEISAPDGSEAIVRFRTSKKRKAGYRQRTTTYDNSNDDDLLTLASSHVNDDGHDDGKDDDKDDGSSAVALAAVQLRNARRGRLFRPRKAFPDNGGHDGANRTHGDNDLDVDPEDRGHVILGGISKRFTPQTGLVASLNAKHMAEYVESRLSSRHRAGDPSAAAEATSPQPPISMTTTTTTTSQPTKHGRLLEVDVPVRSERSESSDRPRRIGDPSTKPRRPRNRRTSEDMKRDQLVDQFLHENRLDVYDVTPTQSATQSTAPGDDMSADDRMAEQFRQQYYDEMAQRRQRKRVVQPASRQQPASDVLKGPKLGGSRNQRAAVRDILLLKQEKEKATRRF